MESIYSIRDSPQALCTYSSGFLVHSMEVYSVAVGLLFSFKVYILFDLVLYAKAGRQAGRQSTTEYRPDCQTVYTH